MQFNPIKSNHQRYWLRFRIKAYAVISAVLLMAVFSFYFVLNWQFLKIADFQVTGLGSEDKNDFLRKLQPIIFSTKIGGVLGMENYFSWPKEIPGLALISPEQPNLDFAGLTITKDLFKHQIIIAAHKRQRLGIICDPGNAGCWWFDDLDGLLIENAPFSQGQLFFTINESTSDNLGLGRRILPAPLFANLKIVLVILKDLNIAIASMELNNALEELIVTANSGWKLIFSLRFDPSAAIGAVKDLLAKTPTTNIEYIDLTVENKIYLKQR